MVEFKCPPWIVQHGRTRGETVRSHNRTGTLSNDGEPLFEVFLYAFSRFARGNRWIHAKHLLSRASPLPLFAPFPLNAQPFGGRSGNSLTGSLLPASTELLMGNFCSYMRRSPGIRARRSLAHLLRVETWIWGSLAMEFFGFFSWFNLHFVRGRKIRNIFVAVGCWIVATFQCSYGRAKVYDSLVQTFGSFRFQSLTNLDQAVKYL